MQIVMAGSGYVGLVSGACLAEIGHVVTCVDVDAAKIMKLRDGISPIYEPGIEAVMRRNQEQGRLHFSTNLRLALEQAEAIFIAVGTPPGENGEADLKYVEAVAREIGEAMQKDLLVLVKSTVPVGSCERVEELIEQALKRRHSSCQLTVASNPEFLKEGSAIADFMQPDRIVVGLKNRQGEEMVRRLYQPFTAMDPNKLLLVDRRASEMIKYTANCMLATRISFMNELSLLCENLGVDIEQVRLGVGSDPRIGKLFLQVGPGFGGSCFPKDVQALLQTAEKHSRPLKILSAVWDVNEQQKLRVALKIKDYFQKLEHKTIAVWGLSFKPGTDDVRESPAKTILRVLLEAGARVQAHDPEAMGTFASEFGSHPGLSMVNKPYEALAGADALVLITEWSVYKWPNWELVAREMRHKAVFDLRNQYEGESLQALGFHYQCIGRLDSLTKVGRR